MPYIRQAMPDKSHTGLMKTGEIWLKSAMYN